MRKPFRTTIDEELLNELKKEAIERNVNANDILEEYLSLFLSRKSKYEYLTQDAIKFHDMPLGVKKEYLKRRFLEEITTILWSEVKVLDVDNDILDVMVEALADLIVRNQESNKKK